MRLATATNKTDRTPAAFLGSADRAVGRGRKLPASPESTKVYLALRCTTYRSCATGLSRRWWCSRTCQGWTRDAWTSCWGVDEDILALLVATYRDDEVGSKRGAQDCDARPHPPSAGSRWHRRGPRRRGCCRVATLDSLRAAELHRRTGGNLPSLSGGGRLLRLEGVADALTDAVLAREIQPVVTRGEPPALCRLATTIVDQHAPWLLSMRARGAGGDADVEECITRHIIAARECPAFRHELAREAVLEALPLGRGTALPCPECSKARDPTHRRRGAWARLAHHAEAARPPVCTLGACTASRAASGGAGARTARPRPSTGAHSGLQILYRLLPGGPSAPAGAVCAGVRLPIDWVRRGSQGVAVGLGAPAASG